MAIILITCLLGCGGPQTGDVGQEEGTNIIESEVSEESLGVRRHHSGPTYYDDDAESLGVSQNSNQATPPIKKQNIHIYVENSGSMYGYVGTGDGSDFRQMVFNYLTDVKILNMYDTFSLYFVNSQVIPRGSSVDDFVNKLKPNTFKVAGGNGGATDIVEIIKKVYPKKGEVSVLVSDCIISPGKGHNAAEYLVNQQTGLKGFLAQQKSISNTGVIIYRMLGHFKGNYFDTVDHKRLYDGIRPYYIWVMGDIPSLKKMREITEPKMKTPPDEICVISMGDSRLKYNIVPAGGKYKISHSDRFTIERLKKVKTAHGDRAVIKLNADFSNMLQDESYLTDVSNYEVSNKNYRVDNVIKTNSNQYIITISSLIVTRGSICVSLKNKPPQWVNKCSDTDGGFPDPNAKLQTTYGLSYLIGGVYDAYTFNGDNLAEMKITIK